MDVYHSEIGNKRIPLKIVKNLVICDKSQRCRNDYIVYKNVCGANEELKLDKMIYSDLLQLREIYRRCYELRVIFSVECCNSTIDKGHYDYLRSLKKKIVKIEKMINK